MSITLHVTEVEAYDDEKQHLFTVRCFDEACAEVVLKRTMHNAESWSEIAAKVDEAIGALKLGST